MRLLLQVNQSNPDFVKHIRFLGETPNATFSGRGDYLEVDCRPETRKTIEQLSSFTIIEKTSA